MSFDRKLFPSRCCVLLASALTLAIAAFALRHALPSHSLYVWLVRQATMLRGSPWAPVATIALCVFGSVIFIPITVLIVASGLMLSPLQSFVCAYLGAYLASLGGFGVGRCGRYSPLGKFLEKKHLQAFSEQVGRHGLVAAVLMRLLPLGPFTAVNVMAGTTRMRWRDFALGCALGLLPVVLSGTMLGHQVGRLGHGFSTESLGGVVVALLLFVALGFGLKRVGVKFNARPCEPTAVPQVMGLSEEGQRSVL